MHTNPWCCDSKPSQTHRIWGQPSAFPWQECWSLQLFPFSQLFFFLLLLLEKLWPTYSSKLFCYVRVIQSNYVTLIATAFSCSVLRVGLEQQGQADGGEIMVTPEIWGAMHSLSCMLIKLMIANCIISILLESKCLHSLQCLSHSLPPWAREPLVWRG